MATLPPATTIVSSLLDESVSRFPLVSGEVLSLRNRRNQRLPISHSKQNAPFSLCERSSACRISAMAASAHQTKTQAVRGEEEYRDEEVEHEEEAAAAAAGSLFDWNSQWYPVSMIDDLDRRVPTAITITGRYLVVSWDSTRRSWQVWDEMGPELTAPLSDAQPSGEGDPQSSPLFGSLECSSQNDHASVYPSVEQDGLLWFWPDTRPEFEDIAARKPPPSIPALTDPAFKDKLYSMNLPYGYKKMIENLLEPACLPFAHDEPQVDLLEDFEKRLSSTGGHPSNKPSTARAYEAKQKQLVCSTTYRHAHQAENLSRESSAQLIEGRLQSGEILSQSLLGESVKEEVLKTDRIELASRSSTSRGGPDVGRVQSSVVLKKPVSSARTKFEERVSETTDPSNISSLSSESKPEGAISDGSNVSCLDLTSSLQVLRRLIFQKDFELAKGRVKELYEKYPRDTGVLMEYAFVEKQLGDLVAAGSLYSRAISAFEDQHNLGYDYVRALQALGSIEARARNAGRARVLFMESIRASRQAEQLFPDFVSGASVYGLHAWARLELELGNWAKARDLLTRAADIQPGNAVVHQSRALLEAKAHNWGAARHHFSLAVESAPKDVKCWHAWAIFEAGQGKQKKMRELFQRALEVDTYSIHCLQAWAHQETLIGTPESKDKARSLFQRCTQIEPKSLYAWQAWAVLEKTSGNNDKARELFEKCLEINPSSVACLQAFANMERHLENWDAAHKLLRKALKLEPENAAVLMEAAFVENSLGNTEVAERLFVQAGMADKRKTRVTNKIFAARKELMPSKAGRGWRASGKRDPMPNTNSKAAADAIKIKREELNSNSIIERRSNPTKAAVNTIKIKREEVNSQLTTHMQSSSHGNSNNYTNFHVVTDAIKAKPRGFLKNSDKERQPPFHLKQKERTSTNFHVVTDAIKAKPRGFLKNSDGERQAPFHLKQKERTSTSFHVNDAITAKPREFLKNSDRERLPPFHLKQKERTATNFQVAIDAIRAKQRELRSTERQQDNKSNFRAAIGAIEAKLRELNSDTEMEEQPSCPLKQAERAPSMLGA